jgi:uncharacterized protein
MSNSLSDRPLPAFSAVQRDDASAAFFDAAGEGRFVLRSCTACGQMRAPEIPMCTKCLGESFEWVDASGAGTIVSWVVLHARKIEGKPYPRPRVMVTVELAEGPWVTAALLGVDPATIGAGRPVTLGFERPVGGEPIPVFL